MSQGAYRDKARGMLVGLAVGDALGAPVEFGYTSSDIEALGDKISHYQNSTVWPAGTWTDDTSMALCLADSLIECHGYDSYDIMNRFWRWMVEGYRTPDGAPAADVGNQTRQALVSYHRNPTISRGTPKTNSAGNGAIMRLAPIVIAGLGNNNDTGERDRILEMARLSCRETHDSYMAIAVTEAFATALHLSFTYGKRKMSTIEHCTCWISRDNERQRECEKYIHDAISDAIQVEDGNEFKNLGGYILDAFKIAVWGLLHSNTFEEGMLKVIRLGGDTDTNAAIYGQLAGVTYGYTSIPKEWRDGILLADELLEISDKLLSMDKCRILRTRFKDNKSYEDYHAATKRELASREYDPNGPRSIGELLDEYLNKKVD